MNLQSAPPWCQDSATRVMGGRVCLLELVVEHKAHGSVEIVS